MNKMKNRKVLSNTLATVLCASTMFNFVGCGGDGQDSEKPIDATKTQLYIGVISEGLNESWLNPVIEAFEKAYPDYQVYIDPYSNETSKTLPDSIATQRQDLYFLQSLDTTTLIKSGEIEDITDIITKGDAAFENGTTIESKMIEGYKEAYQTKKEDGTIAYYSIPYAILPYGITYDADLFEKKGLYNLPQYKGLDCIQGNADDKYGPDGVEGGGDDGLPATWEDFKAMMKVMIQKGITPFIWSGQHASYRMNLMEALIASYEGADNFRLYFDLDGVDYYTGKTITLENGYELVNRPGQKAALRAAYEIVSTNNSKNYSAKSFFMSTSHLIAQNEYIMSERMNKPIAMLVEGAWWEHEAKTTFEEMAGEYGEEYGFGKRNFKFMPLPRFIGTEGIEAQPNTKRTIYDNFGGTVVCMNAASEHKEGAELFLRFVHTQESLKAFTLDNGLIRPYNYSLSATELEKISPFARSIWELYQSSDIEFTNSKVRNERVADNSNYISGLLLSGETSDKIFNDPLANFYSNSTWTVADYIEGKANKYSASRWAATII